MRFFKRVFNNIKKVIIKIINYCKNLGKRNKIKQSDLESMVGNVLPGLIKTNKDKTIKLGSLLSDDDE